MTSAAVASTLESRVGHYYQMDDPYLVGREKVREYARAVQDRHPAHWDVAAAAELGYSGLVAPLTFTSIPGMMANRRLFESVVVGYDTYVQTEEVFEQHRPIVAGDELHTDVELSSVRRIAGRDLITVTNTSPTLPASGCTPCTRPSLASPPTISIRRSRRSYRTR